MIRKQQPLKKYSDFLSSFDSHPNTKDVVGLIDAQSVKQSLKNIVLTNKYERVFRPRVGCNIRALLFDNIDGQSLSIVSEVIKEAIGNYEPRVKLDTINVKSFPDESAVDVNISFYILNIPERQSMNIVIDRVR